LAESKRTLIAGLHYHFSRSQLEKRKRIGWKKTLIESRHQLKWSC